jgi:hypothetical protein
MNPGGVFKENREIPQAARGFSPHDPEVSGATRAWKRAIFKGEAFFRQARLRANSVRDWLLKRQSNSLKKPKTSEKLVFARLPNFVYTRASSFPSSLSSTQTLNNFYHVWTRQGR